MGGDSSDSNMVRISVEDHINAHLLLAECFENNSYEMNSNLNSARILNRKSIRNKEDLYRIQKAYTGENNPFFGKKHKEESLIPSVEFNKRKFGGKTYEEIYGENVEIEKDKRKKSVQRYWDNVSGEEKKNRGDNISKSLKGLMTGAKNPASFPLIVDGILYDCLADALKEFGVCSHTLYKNHNVTKLKKMK